MHTTSTVIGTVGLLVVTAAALTLAAVSAPDPTDQPRRHVATINSSRHTYRLHMGGTMDGANTRSPIGYAAWTQGFEPMRFVRMENVGDVSVVNPWLLVNGKRNWRTAQDIVEGALRSYGDPAKMTEAEKARAIWEYQRHHRFHATTDDLEVEDPVKMYNVYGYTLCGDEAPVLMDLWRLAGLKVRRGFPTGHCVSEVWYEGDWHLLDSDEHVICLERDNATIASEEEVVRDHDLMKRTHTYGIGQPANRMTDEFSASLYVYEGERQGEHRSHVGHTMDLTLRPGEALERRWGHVGKHHYAGKHLREGWGDNAWARVCNGKWIYTPPLHQPAAPQGVAEAHNVRWTTRAGAPAVAPAKVGELASLLWKIETPYVIVGGALSAKVRCGAEDVCAVSISFDRQNWKRVLQANRPSQGEMKANLDEFFPSKGAARYSYFVRADFLAKQDATGVGLDALTIESDLQMAPLSLPALELGENVVTYTDETKEPHAVRVTFDWVERSAARAPAPPAAPVFPQDGAEAEGTQFTFQWEQAKDPDGDKIADYHFQLSDEPTMRWVLSPNFDKQIRLTANKGTASYTIPHVGLLNPGQPYYWRVRARDEKGVWGAWSAVWSFVPQGPGVPLNVRLERKEGGVFALSWDNNPQGRKPVKFAVYASNEKGFSVSDKPYEVNVGNQKDRGWFAGKERETFPANLVVTASASPFALRASRAFYRVVALDERGNKSGASDYAAAPRPLIYSEPVTQAKVGAGYRCEVKTIFSIGDLRCRTFDGNPYHAAFWEAEQPRFSLLESPAWLKIDPRTGVLSGTPQRADLGEHRLIVKVEIGKVGEDVQSSVLKVAE